MPAISSRHFPTGGQTRQHTIGQSFFGSFCLWMIALCNHIGASKLLETFLFSSAFENTSASDIVRVIHF